MSADIDAIFAEEMAKAEGETLATEDEGEYSSDESLGEDEDSGPDDESGELEDETAADDAGEDELSEDDEDEDDEESPEPEPDQSLQRELQQLRQQNTAMQQQMVALQREREAVSQPQQGPPPEFREAVKTLIFGGDEKALQDAGISAPIRTAALRFVRDYSESMVDEAIDPGRAYQRVAPFVEQRIEEAVQKAVAPYQQRRVQQYSQELLERHKGVVKTSADRAKVGEILKTIPEHEGMSWDQQLRRLDIAVEKFQWDSKQSAVSRKEQKVKDRNRQTKANRKASRGRGKTRSKRGEAPPPPDMERGEDLEDFHQRVIEHDRKHG